MSQISQSSGGKEHGTKIYAGQEARQLYGWEEKGKDSVCAQGISSSSPFLLYLMIIYLRADVYKVSAATRVWIHMLTISLFVVFLAFLSPKGPKETD